MSMESEVDSECFDEIRVEVGRETLKMVLVCPGFFGLALRTSLGFLSVCVNGNGARYWRLNVGLLWDVEEIKAHAIPQKLMQSYSVTVVAASGSKAPVCNFPKMRQPHNKTNLSVVDQSVVN